MASKSMAPQFQNAEARPTSFSGRQLRQAPGHELETQLLRGADFGVVVTEQHQVFEFAVRRVVAASRSVRHARASARAGVRRAARGSRSRVSPRRAARSPASTPAISARECWRSPSSSSSSRMKTGTPAAMAPGVSVAGMIISQTCSSSANWSAESAGPAGSIRVVGTARETRQCRGAAHQEDGAQQHGPAIEFLVVDRQTAVPLPALSATLQRTGRRRRAPHQTIRARGNGTTRARQDLAARLQAVLATGSGKRLDRGTGGNRRGLHVRDRGVGGFLEHHRLPANWCRR